MSICLCTYDWAIVVLEVRVDRSLKPLIPNHHLLFNQGASAKKIVLGHNDDSAGAHVYDQSCTWYAKVISR